MKHAQAPLITAVCLIGMLFLWGTTEHQHAQQASLQASISMADSLFGALKGSLQSTLRRGRGYSERINVILENTVKSTRLEHILILQNENILAQNGSLSPEQPQTPEGHRLDNSTLWFWRTTELQDHSPTIGSAGLGHGRAVDDADLNLNDQTQLILLGLDATPLQKRIRVESHRINTAIAAAISTVLIFTAAWIFMRRNRELALQLEQESIRADHLSDLQLSGAGLAHETKNPLGLIRGIAQQMRNNAETPEHLKQMADNIMEQADIAATRLGEFLAFSRKHSPEIKPVDLQAETQKICDLMQYDAEQNGIKLTNTIAPELILADPNMLTQITVNLLTNAIKACKRGDSILLTNSCGTNNTASLTLSDTGCGIPDELQPEIFKPYVTGRPDGHGLGLAIVRRIVEDHNWTIDINSTEGHGTSVTISGLRRHKKERS